MARRRGFTLIEVLIAVAIVVIITAFLGVLFRTFFFTNAFLRESLTIERDATAVLDQLITQLRAAGQSGAGSYPLEVTGANSIVFYANIDADSERERIQYFRSGNDVRRSVVDPVGSPLTYATTTAPETLVTVLRDLAATTTALFSYYDKTYAGTTTPLAQPVSPVAVRLVKVTVVIDADPGQLPPPIVVSSQTAIRNLKDNL